MDKIEKNPNKRNTFEAVPELKEQIMSIRPFLIFLMELKSDRMAVEYNFFRPLTVDLGCREDWIGRTHQRTGRGLLAVHLNFSSRSESHIRVRELHVVGEHE